MLKFLMANKKKIGVAFVALLAAIYAALVVVPGDQKEALVKKVHDGAAELVDQLPPDAE
jgi:hypothetical protein